MFFSFLTWKLVDQGFKYSSQFLVLMHWIQHSNLDIKFLSSIIYINTKCLEILKAQRQISETAVSESVVYMIKHADFQIYMTYLNGIIWKNWQLMPNM